MAEIEHPERYGWWLNELDSLGISTLQKNGLDDASFNRTHFTFPDSLLLPCSSMKLVLLSKNKTKRQILKGLRLVLQLPRLTN